MIFYKIEKRDFEILQKNPFLEEIEFYLYNQSIIKIQNDISQLKKGKDNNILYLIIPDEFSSIKNDLTNKFYYVRLFGKSFDFVNIITESEYKKEFFGLNNFLTERNLIQSLNNNYYLSNT